MRQPFFTCPILPLFLQITFLPSLWCAFFLFLPFIFLLSSPLRVDVSPAHLVSYFCFNAEGWFHWLPLYFSLLLSFLSYRRRGRLQNSKCLGIYRGLFSSTVFFCICPPSSFLSFSLKETPSTLGSLFKKFFFGYVCEQLSYLSLFSFFFLVMFSFSLPYIPSKKYFNIKCPFFFFIASSTTGLSTLPSLPVEFSRQPNKRHHHRHHSSSCRAGDDTTHLS